MSSPSSGTQRGLHPRRSRTGRARAPDGLHDDEVPSGPGLVEGRAILVDGYHRAVGLLALGVTVVPAVVEDAEVGALECADGMLDASTYLGPRPALLIDYLDDAVSTTTTLPHVGRAVTVTAFEFDLDAPLHT